MPIFIQKARRIMLPSFAGIDLSNGKCFFLSVHALDRLTIGAHSGQLDKWKFLLCFAVQLCL